MLHVLFHQHNPMLGREQTPQVIGPNESSHTPPTQHQNCLGGHGFVPSAPVDGLLIRTTDAAKT